MTEARPSMSMWRKIGDLSMAVLILGTGIGLAVHFGDLCLDLLRMTTWQRTPCELGVLLVDRPDPRLGNEVVSGSFRYRFGGEDFESTRLALEPPLFPEPGYADFFVSKLEARRDLRCLVDPSDPRRAVLMIGRSSWETASYWVGLFSIGAILLVGAFSLWRVLFGSSEPSSL